MTTRYIVANQGFLNSGTGDTTYLAQGVTISGGIDMRNLAGGASGNGGGTQVLFINGGVFGFLEDRGAALSGNNQIYIGSTGYINQSWFGALDLGGGGNIIVNNGQITSSNYSNTIYLHAPSGVNALASQILVNNGVITGGTLPGNGGGRAVVVLQSVGGAEITNTGSILSAGIGGQGINVSGVSGSGAITLFNSGMINAPVMMSGTGPVSLTNTGTINGISGISSPNATFVNNSGTMGGLNVTGDGSIVNSTLGTITGPITVLAGNVTVIAGQTGGSVTGSSGNDIFYANGTFKAAENRASTTLDGGLGNNALYGGAAFNTFVLGTWGEHTQVWGGRSMLADVAGYLNNTIQFSNATQGVYVDLLSGHNAFINDSAGAWDGSGVFADWIVNVPNVVGSAYGDTVQADGSGGKITGAGGADALYGATGRDVFAYTAYADSNTVTGYDTVVGFERGTDKIDISGFMAANGLGAASLVLAGSGNSTTVYVERAPGTFNSATDLAFVVNSTAGVLTSADFIM